MLDAAVDHKILLVGLVLRLGILHRLAFGRAVKQFQPEIHFRKRAEFAKARNANLGALSLFGADCSCTSALGTSGPAGTGPRCSSIAMAPVLAVAAIATNMPITNRNRLTSTPQCLESTHIR